MKERNNVIFKKNRKSSNIGRTRKLKRDRTEGKKKRKKEDEQEIHKKIGKIRKRISKKERIERQQKRIKRWKSFRINFSLSVLIILINL